MRIQQERTNFVRMRSLAIAGLLAVALVGAAGFGGPSFSSAKGGSLGKKSGTKIVTKSSVYGKMLFNKNRQAIYMFTRERKKRSKCYGACAAAWPPVLTRGKPKARGKAKKRLLGTTRRKGGTKQVTYRGHPLYYYAHEGPGQVFCHNVFGFGGTWLVLKPNGRPART
ncbi:MAG: hypothetical protein IPK93_02060 [Solirubrobacterales bacterium]|nr:hypothetical protein [Solirubrobacterales bacterium]